MNAPQTDVDLFPGSTEYPRFSELALAREPDGSITFSRAAMERFCRARGRSLDALSEDDMGALLTVHYLWHCLVARGDPEPLLEGLLPQASPEPSEGQAWGVLVRQLSRIADSAGWSGLTRLTR